MKNTVPNWHQSLIARQVGLERVSAVRPYPALKLTD